MTNSRFEWDPEKAAANLDKHGVAFHVAVKSFLDPFAIEHIDGRRNYGEERINMVAMCGGTLLHVTYAERSECIRIISARQAEKHEHEYYYRENRI